MCAVDSLFFVLAHLNSTGDLVELISNCSFLLCLAMCIFGFVCFVAIRFRTKVFVLYRSTNRRKRKSKLNFFMTKVTYYVCSHSLPFM